MANPVLELKGVTKRYGDFTAVNSVSFVAPEGKIVGLLGPNGAGKTSTLRMILGISTPTEGTITLFGKPPGRAVQHRIGYLPEERGLYKRMTAFETIVYFGRLKGLWAATARKRALELLEELGLAHVKDRRIEALSKGMAQKIQLATAIAHAPSLIILDEPFSGLDPINQNELEAAIRKLARNGATVLFSTHTMSHAERLCDRFVILVKGNKAFDGTLQEARAVMPRSVKLESPSDLSFLAGIPGVARIVPPHDNISWWEVFLAAGTDPQFILSACFEKGVKLTRFDTSAPPLHEIFVYLAGGNAEGLVP
ncbi:MAG: ATP-binding cassette domain-containing protein [Alphaproteobacteria bacterium]|nr:ATP-binding cassette domain-containing protein [Alphaproteobacteria bacterium]